MKQKLALACTLVHEPPMLVLDEPTTGVDPVSRREFWKLLAEFLAQGLTIVHRDAVSRRGRAVRARRAAARGPCARARRAVEAAGTPCAGVILEVVVDRRRARRCDALRETFGADRRAVFGDRAARARRSPRGRGGADRRGAARAPALPCRSCGRSCRRSRTCSSNELARRPAPTRPRHDRVDASAIGIAQFVCVARAIAARRRRSCRRRRRCRSRSTRPSRARSSGAELAEAPSARGAAAAAAVDRPRRRRSARPTVDRDRRATCARITSTQFGIPQPDGTIEDHVSRHPGQLSRPRASSTCRSTRRPRRTRSWTRRGRTKRGRRADRRAADAGPAARDRRARTGRS